MGTNYFFDEAAEARLAEKHICPYHPEHSGFLFWDLNVLERFLNSIVVVEETDDARDDFPDFAVREELEEKVQQAQSGGVATMTRVAKMKATIGGRDASPAFVLPLEVRTAARKKYYQPAKGTRRIFFHVRPRVVGMGRFHRQ